MNEIIIANLLFQAGAATLLMLVAGISAARQLHDRKPVAGFGSAPQESRVVDLPAPRVARVAKSASVETHSEAA